MARGSYGQRCQYRLASDGSLCGNATLALAWTSVGEEHIYVMLVGRSGFLFFSLDRDVTDNWVQVADAGKLRRKKGMFGRQSVDKEVIFD
jgi:hypothetical protein